MIITYDEHGGLFDHIVLPVADVYNAAEEPVLDHKLGGLMPGTAVLTFVETSPTRGGLVGAVHANVPNPTVAPPPLLLIPYRVRVPTFVV